MWHLRIRLFAFALLAGWAGWHAYAATAPVGARYGGAAKARFEPAIASAAAVSSLATAESPDDDDGDDIAPPPVGQVWELPSLRFSARATSMPVPLALRDRRASTLVGVVVLLI